jgi:DNA polymerase III subunit gamma/tau
VRYAPVASRYRITIMDEAHQIQDQAASALLKTLEEPPPHLVVILCTTHPWEILGTIRSRLQHFVLRKPGIPSLVRVLDRVARAEGIEAGERALDILARAADGSYRDALGLLDQISTYAGGRVEVSDALELIGAVSRESVFELVDLMAGGDAAGAFELLQSTLDGPVDPEQAIRGLVGHLRHVCLLQQGARPRDEWAFSPEEVARLQAQANQLPASQVVHGLDLLADAQVRVRHGGADPRLQLELVAARLSRPALDASAAALAARVEALEAGAPRAAPVAAAPAPSGPAPAAAAPEPAPPEEPAPVPAPAHEPMPADMEHAQRVWSQVLDALERDAPPTRGLLDGSRPAEIDERRVVVAVTSGLRADMLGRPEHRERVRIAVESVAGRPLAVEFAAGTAPAEEPADEAPPLDDDSLLAEFKSMFSAVEEGERPDRGG